jgi:hypothetical protein
MHDAGADIDARRSWWLAISEEVCAEVVCHHPFGIGVRIVARDELGHLDVTAIRPTHGTTVDDRPSPRSAATFEQSCWATPVPTTTSSCGCPD